MSTANNAELMRLLHTYYTYTLSTYYVVERNEVTKH